MTASLRHRLVGLRASVAWLVLLLLVGAGHVLPAFHFALVVHRVCTEHGELVHEVARTPERTPETRGPALVAVAAAHEHEHCGVPALPSTGVAAPVASAPIARAALGAYAAVAGAERGAHVVIALLEYAPKLAPPSLTA